MKSIHRRIAAALVEIPAVDIHSHLGAHGICHARTLADLVSYHWVHLELARAAGRQILCNPATAPGAYMEEVLPYFPCVCNTVNHYALMGMLRDLYGIKAHTLTARNWRRADEAVRARAGDAGWMDAVLDAYRVERVGIHYIDGIPPDSKRYVPYAYANYLYTPESRHDLARIRHEKNAVPQTTEELESAIWHEVKLLAFEYGIRALHCGIRDAFEYRTPDRAKVGPVLKALAGGKPVSEQDANVFRSFTADTTAEAARDHGVTVRLFCGSIRYAESVAVGTATYWNPGFLSSLAFHLDKHRDTQFDLLLVSPIPSHEAVCLSRVYPNLSISGAWWHGFTPSTMLTFFRDRLEMLPTTCWNAFFSDARMVEWVGGKLLVTRNRLAHALADMIDEGFFSERDALAIARRLLSDNPKRIYGIE